MAIPFIPVPNHLQVNMQFQLFNQKVENVYHFKYTSAPGTTERDDLATAMHTFWTSHLKTSLSPSIKLTDILVTDMSSPSAPQSHLVISPAEAGTVGTNAVQNSSALVVTHRTAARGRNFRGRTYVAGTPIDNISDSNTWGTSQLGTLLSAFAWLLDAAHTAAGIWSVVSKFSSNAPRTLGISTPITAVSADAFMDVQRRRAIGRGT